ncbi:secreted RxLR effector protein 161-like [Vitis riparia]|uniref:secreted RxLR effector protein 161-like n=1 Tax=Vitis riparia TaxID=96939 RepID=UPI00155A14BF|nr:secreted RxLR effector protein 161-like [Vitis riparia]
MDKIPYASTVGSIMYAQVYTRPDIAYVVGMLGRYQSNPGIDHWKAVKKVLRYLQETKDYMLTYRRTDNLEIIGYFDSHYAGCKDTRKSTSGKIIINRVHNGEFMSEWWLLPYVLKLMYNIISPLAATIPTYLSLSSSPDPKGPTI